MRLMGLAWLKSTWLVSTLIGYFLAHSMHVVAPGRASILAKAIGFPQMLHFRTLLVVVMTFSFIERYARRDSNAKYTPT